MFKAVISDILYLLFDYELKDVKDLTKGQDIIVHFIVAIFLCALLFAFIYVGMNLLALKKQTPGVIILLIAFIFTFIVLLKVVKIGR